MPQVRMIADQLEVAVEQIIGTLGVNITAELIERTPVDTGWARANWVPSIGTPFDGNANPVDEETRRSGATAQAGRQQTATAALLAYQIERGSLFITNNVPYVVFLNEGTSSQAPAGFVQDAIMAGIRSIAGRSFG